MKIAVYENILHSRRSNSVNLGDVSTCRVSLKKYKKNVKELTV